MPRWDESLDAQRIGGADSEGRIYIIASNSTGPCVLRFLPDGARDPGYDGQLPDYMWTARILVQPDGKVIAWNGITHMVSYSYGRLLRLTEDGEVDVTFNGLGGAVTQVVEQDDGKIAAVITSTQHTRYISRLEGERLVRLLGDPRPAYYRTWPSAAGRATDDPGGLGIPSLLRYALNLDPDIPNRNLLPIVERVTLQLDGRREDFLSLTFTRRPDAVDLNYIVEASSDLEHWEAVPEENMVRRGPGPDGKTEQVTLADWVPLSEGEVDRRFMRLRVKNLEMPPDLIVTDVRVFRSNQTVRLIDGQLLESDEVTTGGSYVFYATIKNVGGSFTAAGVIHGVSFWVNGQAVSWSDHSIFSLAPGETRHLRANGGPTGTAFWTATEAGQREVMAWVDDIDRMEEADEENNRYFRSLIVHPAP